MGDVGAEYERRLKCKIYYVLKNDKKYIYICIHTWQGFHGIGF